jgi:hypothetical protein
MPEAAESLLYNYDPNQTILCRSRTERERYNPYNVGNGLYRVFIYYCKKDTFFLAPKKGIFHFYKVGRHMPPLPPGSKAP